MRHLTKQETEAVKLLAPSGKPKTAKLVTNFIGLEVQGGTEWVPQPNQLWLDGKELRCLSLETYQDADTGDVYTVVKP